MSLRKQTIAADVMTAARDRLRLVYERFDYVCVSFSGGKDSTAVLQLALEAAAAAGRLPVRAAFWDEEAIHPETIEYVQRVRERPDVDLRWLCLPIRHRNACSRTQPWWECWAPEEEARWVRPMPEGAETTFPGFVRGMTMPESAEALHGPELGMVCQLLGIRAQESIRRVRAVSQREQDNWLVPTGRKHLTRGMPIYDWLTTDVWFAPQRFGWDYNRAYDVMALLGIAPHQQRVCPPFGEEPLRGLGMYAVCWPQLWDRMTRRVHGAATAGRYSSTQLYEFGKVEKPDGLTWEQYLWRVLDLHGPTERAMAARSIQKLMQWHRESTGQAVPEVTPHPQTGISYAYLAKLAHRGDLKGRKAEQVMVSVSHKNSAAEAKALKQAAAGLADTETETRY
jgi:predicted phosphoadenosine phosphosulfate sulfurtransferase